MTKNAYSTLIFTLAFLITTSGCATNTRVSDITVTDATNIATASSSEETKKEPTATAVVTKPTQKINITPTPTAKETIAATTKATETTAPAATTKTTAAPVATTKAPVATTAAPATTTALPPVETTAAPAADYTAVCAEIRSKVIAILEANGQWDEAFTGENNSGGSQWWGVGFYDDRQMSTDDFAQHFYANKFDGMAICGTSINCYMADGNINIAYKGYWMS